MSVSCGCLNNLAFTSALKRESFAKTLRPHAFISRAQQCGKQTANRPTTMSDRAGVSEPEAEVGQDSDSDKSVCVNVGHFILPQSVLCITNEENQLVGILINLSFLL